MTASGHISGLLATATDLVRDGDLERAAWRVADAGLRLRWLLEQAGRKGVCGLDEPTGLRCELPRSPISSHNPADKS